MTNFLNSKGYRLVWTLLGEKEVWGLRGRDENWPGRMEISGYMRMKDGQGFRRSKCLLEYGCIRA